MDPRHNITSCDPRITLPIDINSDNTHDDYGHPVHIHLICLHDKFHSPVVTYVNIQHNASGSNVAYAYTSNRIHKCITSQLRDKVGGMENSTMPPLSAFPLLSG